MRIIKIGLLVLFVPFMFVSSVSAADVRGPECTLPDQSFLGLPTWYKYLEAREDTTGRCNPVLSKESVRTNNGTETESRIDPSSALPIGIAVLEGAIRLAGLVAVVMIFVGAFRFITAQDNPENAKAARKTAINALIGLVIVIVSTGVVSYLGRTVGS